MSTGYKIQAIIDFSIELNKFVNVGLFQRGLYQVRITPRIPAKIPHRVEINYVGPDSSANSLTRSAIQDGSIPPSCVSDKSAVCTIGVITYKNEEIQIDDVFNIKVHLLLNGDYVNEINSAELFFDVELWFSDVVDRPIRASDMAQVSTRSIIIHFDALRGIHYHLPIIFDYFHLSAITITVHGSLISLCSPYNFKIGPDSSHLSPSRVQKLHWEICSSLIVVILKLRKKLSEYLTLIPPWARDRYQKLDSTLKQENISLLAQRCYQKCQENFIKLNASSLTKSLTEEFFRLPIDFPSDDGLSSSSDSSFNNHLSTIESDSAHLCSCLIVLWQSFLRLVTKNDKIIQYLAKLHHSHRIKRFSEGFFTAEKPRRAIHSLCDKTSSEFSEITEKLRASEYFSLLPRCDIECPTLDGNEETLPIIFEEQFDQDLPSSMSVNSFPDFPHKEPTVTDYPNHEKKNLREKLFTNLNRLNFPSSRMREEYSPLSASSQSRKSDGSTQSSLMTSASAYEISSKVTLNKYRKLSDDNDSLLLNDLLNENGKKSPHNNNLSHSDSKSSQLRASESLNSLDLDSVSTEKNMNSTQMALSQLEINNTKDKISPLTRLSASSSNADSKASLKEEYQGTAYFPKPPLEFANSSNSSVEDDGVPDDDVFSDDDSKISSPPTDRAKKYVLRSPRRNSIEPRSATVEDTKCAILDIFRHNQCLMCGKIDCNDCSNEGDSERLTPSLKRLSTITPDLILFVESKEAFRNRVELRSRGFNIYSDFASLASRIPYFQCDQNLRIFSGEGLHLVICVHGLGGNSADLRLVRTYLEIGLPTTNFEFLMSQKNQGETFENFEVMTDRLVQEISYHIEAYSLNPAKISFIGHSLGNVLIRACIARPEMHRWRSKFHTFLSLSGPHLGTAYNTNNIVNMGLWFMQKFKKSESLLQLSMKDASDPKQSFLFKLSQEPGLQYFRYVLLCGSAQDHYVPIHSAHIELTEFALTDSSSWGNTYREMVSNILHPLMNSSHTKLIRYDVHFPSATMSLLGRAAHIAVLDSELFIEKFMVVVGLRYFA